MNSIPPIEELLPHDHPMILLDRIVHWHSKGLVAEVECAKPSLFSDADGLVPTWVGVEYLVQAIAALAGLKLSQEGKEIKIGFLLGVRNYRMTREKFPAEGRLQVEIEEVLLDKETNLAAFDGKILFNDHIFGQGQIKAVMPDDPYQLLRR